MSGGRGLESAVAVRSHGRVGGDGGDETEDGGGSGAPAGVCGCPHTVVAAAAAAVKPFGAFGHVDGVADGDSRKWSSRARCCLCSFASRF